MAFQLNVNGVAHEIDVDSDTPLLWVLRDEIGLTGTKFGCGIGACGACSVHLNGEVARSCSVTIEQAAGMNVTTIEGLSADRTHPVQLAWIAEEVPQCGYCQSGQIMAVAALLDANPNPTDEEVADAITNICRCGTYNRIKAGIKRASASTPETV